MTNDLITIDVQSFGLSKEQGDKIYESFREPFTELAELEPEYRQFENLTGEPPESTCTEAKALKQRYVKIRTTTAAIHKTEKSFFWNAGKCIDAFKNRQLEIGKEREEKLSEIADYYVNLEKERIAKLTEEREAALLACQIDEELYIPPALGEMPEEAWKTYLEGVQRKYDEYQAEQGRIKAEQEAEEKRQREEQERIRQENEKLKAEAEAREKAAAKERAEREKLEKEKRDREEAEARAKAEQEAKEKAEREAKEAAERAAAAAPDKTKLNNFIQTIRNIQAPELSTNGGKRIAEKALASLAELAETLAEETEAL